MSAQHTPGPWHQVPFRLFIEDSRGRQLARVQIGGAETVQEDSANVAFIVRACSGVNLAEPIERAMLDAIAKAVQS